MKSRVSHPEYISSITKESLSENKFPKPLYFKGSRDIHKSIKTNKYFSIIGKRHRNNINMKRILVTGGAGFIGSNLCERLVNEGNDVICLDNYYSGRKENIWHLIDKPNFELVRHDIVTGKQIGRAHV